MCFFLMFVVVILREKGMLLTLGFFFFFFFFFWEGYDVKKWDMGIPEVSLKGFLELVPYRNSLVWFCPVHNDTNLSIWIGMEKDTSKTVERCVLLVHLSLIDLFVLCCLWYPHMYIILNLISNEFDHSTLMTFSCGWRKKFYELLICIRYNWLWYVWTFAFFLAFIDLRKIPCGFN